MEYLGTPGRMIGIRCNTRETVQGSSRYATSTTVEGHRRAQAISSSPREWSISWDTSSPDEISAVSAFAVGAWGNGPWHWVSSQAHAGNMLTPREALLLDRSPVTGLVDGGPVIASDGTWAPRSLIIAIPGTAAVYMRNIPVIPGTSVTYSADVIRRTGIPGLTVGFYDAAGDPSGALAGGGTGTTGVQRISISGVVPEGAVTMGLGVRTEVATLTRPQVTWTPGPVPWSGGHGCRAAIVDGLSEDLITANRHGTLAETSFIIREVA